LAVINAELKKNRLSACHQEKRRNCGTLGGTPSFALEEINKMCTKLSQRINSASLSHAKKIPSVPTVIGEPLGWHLQCNY